MAKNIFIITSNFPPANIVGALRPYRLARRIASRGWKPVIVTFTPGYKSALNFSLLEKLAPETEICYVNTSLSRNNYVHVSEIPKLLDEYISAQSIISKRRTIFTRGKVSCISVFKSWMQPDPEIIRVFPIIRRILSRIDVNDKNVILTTSPPHSLHVAGLILSKLKQLPWIADFRDPWDAYPITGKYELTHPVSRFIERQIMRYADAVLSTTNTATRILTERHFDIPSEKFHTVTNSFDEELMNVPSKRNKDYFLISYTGIFYPAKNPYAFFRALRSWLDSPGKENIEQYSKRLRVRLIGSGDAATRDVIKNLRLTDIVEFIDRVSHQEAIKLTRESDMVLISTGLGEKTRPGWLPSKLFEYLGCRVPILAIIREGEMAEILRECNAGYVITSEDHAAIHSILEKEISNKFMATINKKNSDRFSFNNIERFEEKNVFRNMIKIIENALETRQEN